MANKTFHDGKWHLVTEKCRLGAPCPPFENGVDVQWVPDGAFGDYMLKHRPPAPPPEPEPAPRPGQKIYKVVTQRDAYFGGQFNPESLERLVNKLAADDWHVVGVCTADVSTFWGSFWS